MNHVATEVSEYYYQSLSKKKICMIGNEIRTEDGFSELRLINFSRQYTLKEDEFCDVFGISAPKERNAASSSLTVIVYIIDCPFVFVLFSFLTLRSEASSALLVKNS